MTQALTPAEPTPVIPDYAGPAGDADLAVLVPALRWQLATAVLSGLCVVTCWVFLRSSGGVNRDLALRLHGMVYALTLTSAYFASTRLIRAEATFGILRSRPRLVLDLLAGIGLVILGFGPLFALPYQVSEVWQVRGLAAAFTLLAVTTYRHRLLYSPLARVMRSSGRYRVGNQLAGLGWTKAIYEGAWLTCCAVPLIVTSLQWNTGGWVLYMAFGAMFGSLGFAFVWLLMIVIHAVAAGQAARPATR